MFARKLKSASTISKVISLAAVVAVVGVISVLAVAGTDKTPVAVTPDKIALIETTHDPNGVLGAKTDVPSTHKPATNTSTAQSTPVRTSAQRNSSAVITSEIVTEIQIPFAEETTKDLNQIRKGVNGVRRIIYSVSTVDGQETSRTVISDTTTQATAQVVYDGAGDTTLDGPYDGSQNKTTEDTQSPPSNASARQKVTLLYRN